MMTTTAGIILMCFSGMVFFALRLWVSVAREPGRTPESRSMIATTFFCSGVGFFVGLTVAVLGTVLS